MQYMKTAASAMSCLGQEFDQWCLGAKMAEQCGVSRVSYC